MLDLSDAALLAANSRRTHAFRPAWWLAWVARNSSSMSLRSECWVLIHETHHRWLRRTTEDPEEVHSCSMSAQLGSQYILRVAIYQTKLRAAFSCAQ
jgi:fatty-acid desaturase